MRSSERLRETPHGGNDAAREGTREELKPGEAAVTLSAVVQKVVPGIGFERAQIEVHGADDLYCELRIANALKDKQGNEVKLTPGTGLEVVIKVRPDVVKETAE